MSNRSRSMSGVRQPGPHMSPRSRMLTQNACSWAPCCSPAVRGQGRDTRRAWSQRKWDRGVHADPSFFGGTVKPRCAGTSPDRDCPVAILGKQTGASNVAISCNRCPGSLYVQTGAAPGEKCGLIPSAVSSLFDVQIDIHRGLRRR